MPPLRVRGDDILVLARQFPRAPRAALVARSGRAVGCSCEEAPRLSVAWKRTAAPELHRARGRGRPIGEITIDDLPDDVRNYHPTSVEQAGMDATSLMAEMPHMEEIEQRYIRQVLAAVAGNKTQAAQILGFDRRTLYRKLDRMNEATATSPQASA